MGKRNQTRSPFDNTFGMIANKENCVNYLNNKRVLILDLSDSVKITKVQERVNLLDTGIGSHE